MGSCRGTTKIEVHPQGPLVPESWSPGQAEDPTWQVGGQGWVGGGPREGACALEGLVPCKSVG